MMFSIRTKGARTSGFTFIEIAIVMVIIGIIIGIVGRRIGTGQTEALKLKAQVTLSNLKVAILKYHSDMLGQYPATLQDLITKPATVKAGARWNGPYIEESELTDPWGNLYVYARTSGVGKKPFELYSWGPEGEGSEKKIYAD
jgi:general secretion pathway protein G